MKTRNLDPVDASIAPRVRYAGSFVGILGMCAAVLLIPVVARTLGLPVPPAWGLTPKHAGLLCLVGAIPGFMFAPAIAHLGKSSKLIG